MPTRGGNGHSVEIERVLEDLKAVVRDGQELLKATASNIKERAAVGAEKAREAVQERPYQSLAVVFGAGLLAGVLVAGMFSGKAETEEEED